LNKETVTVHIKYKDTEQTYTGSADQIWASMNRFFSEMIPALQIVKKVLLTIDLENLIEECKGIIAVAPEGPALLVSKKKLTDSETLLLHLIASYIGKKLGLYKNYLTKEELRAVLGKSSKITSTRLGELTREGLAIRTKEGNYWITTLGIKRFQKEALPQILEKLQKT
jgi:hypothetical protein